MTSATGAALACTGGEAWGSTTTSATPTERAAGRGGRPRSASSSEASKKTWLKSPGGRVGDDVGGRDAAPLATTLPGLLAPVSPPFASPALDRPLLAPHGVGQLGAGLDGIGLEVGGAGEGLVVLPGQVGGLGQQLGLAAPAVDVALGPLEDEDAGRTAGARPPCRRSSPDPVITASDGEERATPRPRWPAGRGS